MTRRAARILALIALAALPACSGTETGNPPFAPDVGAGGFDPQGIAPDPEIDGARVAASEAALEDCEGASFPLFRGAEIDFVRGTLSASEWLEVPEGTYCAITLHVASCVDPDACRTVSPDAIAIDGVRRADGAAVIVRDAVPIEVRLEGAFELSPDAGGLLLALDRNALVSGLAISALAAEAGVVRIDATSNADRLDSLRAALPGALTLRRDLDGDGALDPEELAGEPLASER